METLLTNNDNNSAELRYVVMVNGQEVSARYSTKIAAEGTIEHLSPELQALAEVVTVTTDGNQLLLG